MINKIKIQNYKSITNLEISLGKLNIFIDENGCGKTNILEAITCCSIHADIGSGGLTDALISFRVIRIPEPYLLKSAFETISDDDVTEINISNEFNEKFGIVIHDYEQKSDILVGAITHCLDFESSGKKHEGKHELGKQFYPLIKKILRNSKDTNSKYNYYRKYDVNFFSTVVSEKYKDLKQYLHKKKPIKIQSFIQKEKNKKYGQQELKF